MLSDLLTLGFNSWKFIGTVLACAGTLFMIREVNTKHEEPCSMESLKQIQQVFCL